MDEPRRGYRYVGPEELRAGVESASGGAVVRTAGEFEAWAAAQSAGELAEPFTFVVGPDGLLRLAPRRSEHVACARGERVLGAGEVAFRQEGGRWRVRTVSNQSTGYCPDLASWPAVASALDRIGVAYPPGFTHEVVFRRCDSCRELNIVREEHFVCVFCDEDLPRVWNVS